MALTATETRINELFEELVPPQGKADTVAGEIIRAVCRLHYRNWNDGDHVGVGYGKETCNPAARFLAKRGSREMETVIYNMWGDPLDDSYDASMEILLDQTIQYIDDHPELKTAPNAEDMFDYRDKYEDVDDEDEDDDSWY